MNTNPLKKLLGPLLPFFIAGLALAIFIGLLFMFSYILLWGLLIGAVLWIISTLKQLIFPVKPKANTASKGRIIEHEPKK